MHIHVNLLDQYYGRTTRENNGVTETEPYHANVKFWSHSSIIVIIDLVYLVSRCGTCAHTRACNLYIVWNLEHKYADESIASFSLKFIFLHQTHHDYCIQSHYAL